MKRYAFTMIELVFVIVVLGILAAVALPRLGSTMVSAQIAKAQGDVAAIRSSIASARQKMLVRGRNVYPSTLDNSATTAVGQKLFDQNGTDAQVSATPPTAVKILSYPIYSKNSAGGWSKYASMTNVGTASSPNYKTKYKFIVDSTDVVFSYYSKPGLFDCHGENTGDATAIDYCKKIAE